MPKLYTKNEDLNGYLRGAHQDGDDVCDGYEFHLPGSSSTPDHVVWGWNDVASFDCEKCKRPATEHIVLREPPRIDLEEARQKKERERAAQGLRKAAPADPTVP